MAVDGVELHRRFCPRCGQTMMLEYRRFERIADMLWVWRCVACGHLAPAKRHEYE